MHCSWVQIFDKDLNCFIYWGYWSTIHWKSFVSKKDAKANINLVELKFCKVEEVRKYFAYFVKLQYLQFRFQIYRSSHSRNFFGTSALKNIAMLEFIFNKVAGFQARNFIKKRLQHRCFSVKFAKSLRASFLQNIYGGCFWKYLMNSLFIA